MSCFLPCPTLHSTPIPSSISSQSNAFSTCTPLSFSHLTRQGMLCCCNTIFSLVLVSAKQAPISLPSTNQSLSLSHIPLLTNPSIHSTGTCWLIRGWGREGTFHIHAPHNKPIAKHSRTTAPDWFPFLCLPLLSRSVLSSSSSLPFPVLFPFFLPPSSLAALNWLPNTNGHGFDAASSYCIFLLLVSARQHATFFVFLLLIMVKEKLASKSNPFLFLSSHLFLLPAHVFFLSFFPHRSLP